MHNKKEIEERIHQRILETINAVPNKQKQYKTWAGIAATIIMVLAGTFFGYKYYNTHLKIHQGEFLYAKKQSGKIILENGNAIDIEDLMSSNQNYPIQISRDSNLTILKAIAGNTDEHIKIRTNQGGSIRLILPDESIVYLNSNTNISYPVNFLSDRTVFVEGNAYFEVNKKMDQTNRPMPFKVIGGDNTVEVLGTQFDFIYSTAKGLNTTLIEGSIHLENSHINNKNYLLPGQQAIVDKQRKLTIKSVDTEEFSLWKQGFYYFKDRPLPEIIQQLQQDYGFTFELANIPSPSLTLIIKKDRPLSEILQLIEQISAVKFYLKGNQLQYSPSH